MLILFDAAPADRVRDAAHRAPRERAPGPCPARERVADLAGRTLVETIAASDNVSPHAWAR